LAGRQCRARNSDLTIRFGGHVAVDHVSCAFAPGTLTAIVGPQRGGQDHLLQPDLGQLPASEGSVLLNGEDITRACRRRTRTPAAWAARSS
jgi:ABC-type branched-subunit amino acid transport system ATPase component